MPEFNQYVGFVRYTMANANSDALHLTRMKEHERKTGGAKKFDLEKVDDPYDYERDDMSGGFSPFHALRNRAMSINYNPANIEKRAREYFSSPNDVDPETLGIAIHNKTLEIAAHEYFHGCVFWGNKKPLNIKNSFHVLTGAVLITAAAYTMSALDPAHETFYKGMGYAGIGGLWLARSRAKYAEEKNAYSFGYLFNPRSYADDTPVKPHSTGWTKFREDISEFLGLYPSKNIQARIFAETKQKCVGGNALFPKDNPPDVAFEKWLAAGSPKQ